MEKLILKCPKCNKKAGRITGTGETASRICGNCGYKAPIKEFIYTNGKNNS